MGSRLRSAIGAVLVGIGVSFIARRARARAVAATQHVPTPVYVHGLGAGCACGQVGGVPYDAPVMINQALELPLVAENGNQGCVVLNGPFHLHRVIGKGDGTSEVEVWFGPFRESGGPGGYLSEAYNVSGTPDEIKHAIEQQLTATWEEGHGGAPEPTVAGVSLSQLRQMVNALFSLAEQARTPPIVEQPPRGWDWDPPGPKAGGDGGDADADEGDGDDGGEWDAPDAEDPKAHDGDDSDGDSSQD